MKKIFLFFTVASLLLVSCSNENYIRAQIQKSDYCGNKEDCVLVDSKCPFGCYIYSNAKEAARIKKLIDSYSSNCMYTCIQCSDVECREGRCAAVC